MRLPFWGEVKQENRLPVLIGGGVMAFFLVITLLQTGLLSMSIATKEYSDTGDVKTAQDVADTIKPSLETNELELLTIQIQNFMKDRCEPGYDKTLFRNRIWNKKLDRWAEIEGRPMRGIPECAE